MGLASSIHRPLPVCIIGRALELLLVWSVAWCLQFCKIQTDLLMEINRVFGAAHVELA